MFRVLGASVERLSDEDRGKLGDEAEQRLKFAGFDLNDSLEARFLTYLRYLLRAGRWEELGERLKEIGDRGNSHRRNLPLYRRMLEVHRPLMDARTRRGRDTLSLEEL